MTWTPKQSRVALVVVPALVVVAFGLGTIRGKLAHASYQGTPYTQSTLTPFVPGNFFTVSIQNPLYTGSSQILFAQAFSPTGAPLGFLAVDNQAINQVTINGTPVFVITAVFNPTLRKTQPTIQTLSKDQPKPAMKAMKKEPEQKDILPVISTGSTICITTNVTGDGCPTMNPITINVTNVNPCP